MKRLSTTLWTVDTPFSSSYNKVPTKDAVSNAFAVYLSTHNTVYVECEKEEIPVRLVNIAGVIDDVWWNDEGTSINASITLIDTMYGKNVGAIIDAGKINNLTFEPMVDVITTENGEDVINLVGFTIKLKYDGYEQQ